MTQVKESPYIALRPFRFGNDDLQIGDAVPVESGRDYHALQLQGYIGLVNPAAAAPHKEPEPERQELSTFEQGEAVLVVYDDGAYDRAEFISFAEADKAAQQELELGPGELVALVQVDGEQFAVPLASVLPMHPVGKLLELFEARARNNDSREQEAAQALDAAELRIRAMLEPGDPLPDDLAGKKEVEAYGIRTLGGLKVLATDAKGKANLTGIPGVGDKTADKMLAALGLPAGA